MLAGGMYVAGAPLAVCGRVREPQAPGVWQIKSQSTPAFAGSWLTTAVKLALLFSVTELGGGTLNASETALPTDAGGGALRTTVGVPVPQPMDIPTTIMIKANPNQVFVRI
jgi:hypothetical protein